MMASTPTASGRSAATTLPNTTTSSSRVIGNAIISARCRSDSTRSLTAWFTTAGPPAVIVRAPWSPSTASVISTARSLTVSSSPANRTSTRAVSPLVLLSGGGLPSDQYDAAWSTPGSAASCAVRSAPAAAAAGLSTLPSAERASRTMSGWPWWKVVSMTSAARDDSDDGSSKPPPVSDETTPPP